MSISIETDEGSVNIGGTEIPDDFPLPVPDYEEVVGVVTQTGEFASSMVTLSFDPDFDDVAALYEDFFDEDGWEVSRTESNADGDRMVIFYASKDAVSASAIVGYNDGEERRPPSLPSTATTDPDQSSGSARCRFFSRRFRIDPDCRACLAIILMNARRIPIPRTMNTIVKILVPGRVGERSP